MRFLESETWSNVVVKLFKTLLGSETILNLSDFLIFDPAPLVDLQLIVDIKTGSTLRYP